jgi:hypothetical protein
MESRDHWHRKVLQQLKNVATGIPSKNAVLMLQTHYVDMTAVQEVCSRSIGRNVALFNLQSHPCWVSVQRSRIVDGDDRHSTSSVLGSHRIAQIGSESCNSTLTGKVVSDDRDPERKRPARHYLQTRC